MLIIECVNGCGYSYLLNRDARFLGFTPRARIHAKLARPPDLYAIAKSTPHIVPEH